MKEQTKGQKEWFLGAIASKIPGRLERKRVREEFEDHMEELAAELMAQGMDEDRALLSAIKQMGDVGELAYSLGKIHRYDTAGAYRQTVNLLWVSFVLSIIRINIGPAFVSLMIQTLMQILFLVSLFRLKNLHPALKKAFLWAMICFGLNSLGGAADALMWENVRNLCGNVRSLLAPAASILKWYYLMKGLCGIAYRRQTLIKAGFWLCALFEAALAAASIVHIVRYGLFEAAFGNQNIQLNNILGIAFFLIAVVVFIVSSGLVKGALTDNEEAGIGPFSKKAACILSGILFVILILPGAASAVTALLPVKTTGFSDGNVQNETDRNAREALQARLLETSKDALVQRFMELLPAEEVDDLLDAERIWIEECAQSKNCAFLVSLKTDEDIAEEYNCHIGCLTELDAPFQGYAAVSSVWVDVIEDINRTPDFPAEANGGRDQWFFCERGGVLYEFAPRKREDTGVAEMTAAEITLPRNADHVYCYQTIEINALKPADETYSWIGIGHETAIQKSLERLPFAQTAFDASMDEYFAMDFFMEDQSAQMVFRRGSVSNMESVIWKRSGCWDYLNCRPETDPY